ncbi:MAG: DUF5606 domain-containing protein [Bacteroidales bacterium]|nr:DUF5606 domain-containing protein [Candidatus Cacconaster scatequi]
MEKTDLKKIISISGEHGLFEYVAQTRNGIIAQSLITGQRKAFGPSSKVSSLSDISIYTEDGEVSMKQVLESIAEKAAKAKAMDSKSNPDKIKEFFKTVLPTYDEDRFYVSHMKKVLDWYNCLAEFGSLEFVEEEEEKKDE